MEYEVIFSEPSDNDIDEIIEYISLDNPEKAIIFVKELKEKTRKFLSIFPHAGSEIGFKNKYHAYGNYVLIYDIDETNKKVYIKTIIESHRDWKN